MRKLLILFIIGLFFIAKTSAITPEGLLKTDIKKDYSNKSVSELRLIRAMVYARHNILLMESDLRDYFFKNFKWYEDAIYKAVEMEYQSKKISPSEFSAEELAFTEKIDFLIKKKNLSNYLEKDSMVIPNINNIANNLYENNYAQPFLDLLKKNNFAVEKAKHEQLFHLYDQNSYENIPSFITTDLFLQLYHIYFSYILKDIEKEKLSMCIENMTLSLFSEALKYVGSANEQIKEMAEFNACFFAVAYTLLTDKKLTMPAELSAHYVLELSKVKEARDTYSSMFKCYINYSNCTPRGYYTRTAEQQRYFRSFMWLQTAPFCLSDRNLLKYACFNAFLLKYGKQYNSKPIKNLYDAIYEPIAFLVGDADNLSVNDICDIYTKYNINSVNLLAGDKMIDLIASKLKDIVNQRDKITPKIKISCQPKINFMPQRYLADNDILQQFVDTARNAAKAYPRGLEVFDVLGISEAHDILYNFCQENTKWKDYDSVMKQQKVKFKNFNEWDNTVYNKWLQSLIRLNSVNKEYPAFMHTKSWRCKNLNTSLASWAQLKHDVVLYAEEPSTAECGAGGTDIPDPITVGYVEPNLQFWKTCRELLLKNESFLFKYNLMTKELISNSKDVLSILDFFISVTTKELANETLTDDEYNQIKDIGGKFDYLSLNMLNPYANYSDWYEVQSPDKTIALVVDVYNRNVPNCPKDGLLYEATGLGNTIHVLVEINGMLYLTRGAVFSYYEFAKSGERLTDEDWLEVLNKNEIKPVDWMDEFTIKQIKN